MIRLDDWILIAVVVIKNLRHLACLSLCARYLDKLSPSLPMTKTCSLPSVISLFKRARCSRSKKSRVIEEVERYWTSSLRPKKSSRQCSDDEIELYSTWFQIDSEKSFISYSSESIQRFPTQKWSLGHSLSSSTTYWEFIQV